jgi:hypothetical protein
MTRAADHKAQANHNRSFLSTIDKARFPDWAATVIFYTAVHRVQELLRTKGGKGGGHVQRNRTLRTKYPKVWREYQPLYTFSRLARYWCMQVKPDHVPYVERRLGRVEREIDAELKT